jgi:hypothetical protein
LLATPCLPDRYLTWRQFRPYVESMSNTESFQDRNLLKFAQSMRSIPRQALRCDLYGTISVVVDRRHVTAIFRKIAPCATRTALHDAMVILQDRLDESMAMQAALR